MQKREGGRAEGRGQREWREEGRGKVVIGLRLRYRLSVRSIQ